MKAVNITKLGLIINCCLGVLIYSNVFTGSFHLDDFHSITTNTAITEIFNFSKIWRFWPTRFVTYFSLALNYYFHQLHLFGYHFINLLVHLGSGILVWWITVLTFSTPAIKGQKLLQRAGMIPFLVGLVFIVHPLQTQGVSYIIQRAASLATFFYLTTLWLYIKSRLLQQTGSAPKETSYFYGFALLASVIAMFTKEMVISLPLMLCLYEFSFLRVGRKFNWKYPAPFLAIAFIVPLTMLFTRSSALPHAVGARAGISPWHYLLTQFRVMVTYIRLAFLLINQNLDYDYPILTTWLDLSFLGSLFILGGILILAFKLFRAYRLSAFGIFWFFLALLPESSVIPVKDVIFEHRAYLAIVGYGFFLVSGLYYLFNGKRVKFFVLILSILLSLYSVATYKRNRVWKDEFSLWNDVIAKSPGKARPYYNRANAYSAQGNFDQAILDYSRAIALMPDVVYAYFNRGKAYSSQAKFDLSILDYSRAIALDPDFAQAYNERALVYASKSNYDQAVLDYTQALELNPALAEVYNNRAVAYYFKQEYEQAWADLRKAGALGLSLHPGFLEALKKKSGVTGD